MKLIEAQWRSMIVNDTLRKVIEYAYVLDSASSTRSSVKFNELLDEIRLSLTKLTETQCWNSAKLTGAQWRSIAYVLDIASSTGSSMKFNESLDETRLSSMKLNKAHGNSIMKLGETKWNSLKLNDTQLHMFGTVRALRGAWRSLMTCSMKLG